MIGKDYLTSLGIVMLGAGNAATDHTQSASAGDKPTEAGANDGACSPLSQQSIGFEQRKRRQHEKTDDRADYTERRPEQSLADEPVRAIEVIQETQSLLRGVITMYARWSVVA